MFHLFFRCMLQVCLSGCCIYFTHMLQVFYLNVTYVLQWLFKCFFASVSDAYLKCFVCLRTYVANVSSGCFKSRSGVAHVPLLSLPFFPFPPSYRGSSSSMGKPYPTSTQMPSEVLAPGGLMRRDARLVAPEQDEVRAVHSLCAGNKQPRASVRTFGR